MKKRILSLLVVLTMLCTFVPCAVNAYDGTQYGDRQYGDYFYHTNGDNTVTITDCDESVTSVEIPSQIDGMSVTSIGAGMFRNCSSLMNISIPDSVTSIGWDAFYDCSALTSKTVNKETPKNRINKGFLRQ